MPTSLFTRFQLVFPRCYVGEFLKDYNNYDATSVTETATARGTYEKINLSFNNVSDSLKSIIQSQLGAHANLFFPGDVRAGIHRDIIINSAAGDTISLENRLGSGSEAPWVQTFTIPVQLLSDINNGIKEASEQFVDIFLGAFGYRAMPYDASKGTSETRQSAYRRIVRSWSKVHGLESYQGQNSDSEVSVGMSGSSSFVASNVGKSISFDCAASEVKDTDSLSTEQMDRLIETSLNGQDSQLSSSSLPSNLWSNGKSVLFRPSGDLYNPDGGDLLRFSIIHVSENGHVEFHVPYFANDVFYAQIDLSVNNQKVEYRKPRTTNVSSGTTTSAGISMNQGEECDRDNFFAQHGNIHLGNYQPNQLTATPLPTSPTGRTPTNTPTTTSSSTSERTSGGASPTPESPTPESSRTSIASSSTRKATISSSTSERTSGGASSSTRKATISSSTSERTSGGAALSSSGQPTPSTRTPTKRVTSTSSEASTRKATRSTRRSTRTPTRQATRTSGALTLSTPTPTKRVTSTSSEASTRKATRSTRRSGAPTLSTPTSTSTLLSSSAQSPTSARLGAQPPTANLTEGVLGGIASGVAFSILLLFGVAFLLWKISKRLHAHSTVHAQAWGGSPNSLEAGGGEGSSRNNGQRERKGGRNPNDPRASAAFNPWFTNESTGLRPSSSSSSSSSRPLVDVEQFELRYCNDRASGSGGRGGSEGRGEISTIAL